MLINTDNWTTAFLSFVWLSKTSSPNRIGHCGATVSTLPPVAIVFYDHNVRIQNRRDGFWFIADKLEPKCTSLHASLYAFLRLIASQPVTSWTFSGYHFVPLFLSRTRARANLSSSVGKLLIFLLSCSKMFVFHFCFIFYWIWMFCKIRNLFFLEIM